MNILFLCDDLEDYLADGILHGLKQLEGIRVIDYPKKECLYDGGRNSKDVPELGVRGGGFTLYGLLQEPSESIDRNQIRRKLEIGWFDAVFIGNVWRQWGVLMQWQGLFKNLPVILLDGDDDARFFPFSGTRIRQYGLGSGLRSLLHSPSTYYFKRELTMKSKKWLSSLNVSPICFSIPEERIDIAPYEKKKMFPCHIVDSEIAPLLNGSKDYAFTDEDSYRSDLRMSRFGITTRRAGWDCLRHYELAASGAILCFRDLHQKPFKCAPSGLRHMENCISYSSYEDLLRILQSITHEKEYDLRKKTLEWVSKRTTKLTAKYVLSISRLCT